ncbi:MAG: glycosyltransferase family 2 protein [Taibaiella sp.]|nr:glycosyltransferase family 2 protein [Taibaiella sp.]
MMFSAKWLVCVFSYNRGAYLKNVLLSIQKYYPEFSVAIFDDGSTDPNVKKVLAETPNSTYIHVIDKPVQGSKHGGLHKMMNSAVTYAIQENFDYVYFVQDDMQFLWRDVQLENRVKHIFEQFNCIMCNLNFLQKIFRHDAKYELLPTPQVGVFEFLKHGVGDTGVIDVKKAKDAGLEFPYLLERDNGEYWYNKGFRLYWLAQPNLAWLPWPEAYRFKKASKGRVHSVRELTETDMQRLRLNTGYTYLEDYARIDAFLLKPYWQGAHPGWFTLLKIYIKYYLGVRLIKAR